MAAMKKIISAQIILLLFLVPALGNASYLLRLKNGGQLSTPAYWFEDRMILFYCPGGTAGMERREIDRIDRIERVETYDNMGTVGGNIGKKATPLPPKTEKQQEPGETPQAIAPAKEAEEKVNIEAYRSKKAEMMVELDETTKRLREATLQKDNAAKEKAKEEMRKTSAQIYNLTDEVTKKNKGKLPEGWWEKK
jgi:hypothetical protein